MVGELQWRFAFAILSDHTSCCYRKKIISKYIQLNKYLYGETFVRIYILALSHKKFGKIQILKNKSCGIPVKIHKKQRK